MLPGLEPIKTRIQTAERVTRDDVSEALLVIDEAEGDRESEITELVENLYNADQTAKLISSLGSY